MVIEPSDSANDLTYVYTTQARLIRLLGSSAVEGWSDHSDVGDTDSDVVSDAIYEATAEINLYLLGLYSDEDLVTSAYIVNMATKLAGCRLCQNRGNDVPGGLAAECERILETLDRISKQDLLVPGLPMRADMRPTISNRQIDRRYLRRTVRVDRQTSTASQTMLRQDRIDSGPWYGW